MNDIISCLQVTDDQTKQRGSIQVLQECIELQLKKASDYQNSNSSVSQADYYPSGCKTIYEIMHAKMLRIKSVMQAMENDKSYNQNFESLEDSAKDLINYASFFVAWLRGNIDGQDNTRDLYNHKRETFPAAVGAEYPEYASLNYIINLP